MIASFETELERLRAALGLTPSAGAEAPLETVTRVLGIAARGPGFAMPAGLASAPRAVARVNASRWIADCPLCAGGAELVCLTDPRFLCLACVHAGTPAQGRWLKIELPAARARRAIEAELLRRPEARTRNWFPWETAEDLRHETEVHMNGIERWRAVLEHRAGGIQGRDLDAVYLEGAEAREGWERRDAGIRRARIEWEARRP